MAAIRKIFNWLYKIQTVFAVFSLSILCTMIIIQVFLRYVMNSPLFGIEEMELFPIIWVYLFGGSMASYEKTHIQCGIVGVFCKNEKIIYIFALIRDVVCFIISCVLCYWVYGYFAYCLGIRKLSGVLHLPLIYAQGAVFVCLVIMAVFALRDIIETILSRRKTYGGDV